MKTFLSLCRGLCLAPFLFFGPAAAQTFENFAYTADATSVTITGYSGLPPAALVIPAQIAGLPVKSITGLGSVAPTSVLRSTVTAITIPDGVTTISGGALKNLRLITSITIPDSVTSLEPGALSGCIALTSAVLPDGLTVLESTFSGCTALTSVTLPSRVTTMSSTFAGCTSLASIVLPASVTALVSTFRGCTSLTHIDIPPAVTTLAFTFEGCINLMSVTLPPGLTQIGDYAFFGCTRLMPPAFPASLTAIGASAFENCIGFTSLVVPETVTQIGDSAFWGCRNITSLSLPERFLASLANIGLDYNAKLASDTLINGIANNLASNPAFVTKLANEIISKTGHYGLSTQDDVTDLANMTPQTVRTVLAEIAAEQPSAHLITSDLTSLSIKKGRPAQYTVTTNFNATAFSAVGLPVGMAIHPTTGVVSGKSSKVGTYSVFLYAGIPGGRVVNTAKIFVITP
jgi:hypothetical protein